MTRTSRCEAATLEPLRTRFSWRFFVRRIEKKDVCAHVAEVFLYEKQCTTEFDAGSGFAFTGNDVLQCKNSIKK